MGPRAGVAGAGKFGLRQNAEINVTPFVDVMLVLLIIFMVAAPLPTRSILMEIPPASRSDDIAPPPVEVSIQSGGRVIVDQKPVPISQLTASVRAAQSYDSSRRVMVRADRAVPYREVMDVVNELNDGGRFKIGFVTEDL